MCLKSRQRERFAPSCDGLPQRTTFAKPLYQLRLNHLSGARSGVPSGAMAKLLDQRRAIRLLTNDGWTESRGGKHVVKMVKDGQRPVTLPRNHGQPYSKGLSAAIVKQAGVKSSENSKCASRSSSTTTARSTGQRSPSSPDASRQAER
ncbi:MAG: type II toxin-antitoxin system HicA family toxin [Solirubrobacteraceae bacterium]